MTSRASRPWKNDLLEIALIFAVFCVQGAWPVPDVNEPYYLGKAIHSWDPDWVRGDFFLDSADAHWVFYFAFGWLGRVMAPAALAWFGRVLTWGLLAWSWQRLSWALVPRRGMAVLSGALWACLMERCHMAGEWVIGGVEAKGFAYVLVLLGLEAMVRGRWNRAWLLFGGATLVHVLAGGWVVLAAGLAWLVLSRKRLAPWRQVANLPHQVANLPHQVANLPHQVANLPHQGPPLRSRWPGLLGGLAIALPSVISSLALDWGTDSQTVARACEIYVFYRLPHHLIVSQFPWHFMLRFTAMVVVWALVCVAVAREDGWPAHAVGAGCQVAPPAGGQERLRAFVVGALAIALVGALLNLLMDVDRSVAARLLRFYWFRLADVAVPMGVALFAALLIGRWLAERPRLGRWGLAALVFAAAAHAGDLAALRLHPQVPRADAKVQKIGGYAAWRDACEWIARSGSIPKDARFLTPIDSQTFKWYTRRPEVVTRKDIPQDAQSIVQWWERLRDIHGIGPDEPTRRWHATLAELGEARIGALGEKYHADYVLTEAPGVELPETEMQPKRIVPRLGLKALYENDGYIIYQLRETPNP
jgi:hypothetical protein